MNFKNISVAIAIGTTILLSACGGGGSKSDEKSSGDYNLTVNENLSGALSESYKVNKSVLKISDKSFGTKLLVEVERIGSDLPFDANDAQVCGVGAGKTYEWCVSADILGDNDMPVETNLDKYGYDPFEKMPSLKQGETVWLEFSLGYDSELETNPEKAKKVKLTSSLEERDLSGYSSSSSETSSDDNTTSVSSSGSEDWDEMLDDYEEYVDEYIKFYKKAMKGDNSAMSEYPAMMEKATALQQSMAKAQNNNELSATQIQRMMKIQTKMTNAALEMQN